MPPHEEQVSGSMEDTLTAAPAGRGDSNPSPADDEAAPEPSLAVAEGSDDRDSAGDSLPVR